MFTHLIEGKCVEVACSYLTGASVDFDIYERGKWDSGDVGIYNCKGTGPTGRINMIVKNDYDEDVGYIHSDYTQRFFLFGAVGYNLRYGIARVEILGITPTEEMALVIKRQSANNSYIKKWRNGGGHCLGKRDCKIDADNYFVHANDMTPFS